jgi:phage replication-related protein YjqB (UPF0714/DUF867 family)
LEGNLKILFKKRKWRKPKLSRRVLAEMKIGARNNGLEWPMSEKINEKIKNHGFIKNFRETKTMIEGFKKVNEINKNLRGNQERLEKLREENKEKRYKDPLEFNRFFK